MAMHNTSPIVQSLPGSDDINRTVLPNGIVVLSRTNFNSPSVVISGYITAGSIFDPEEKLGLADFVAAALMRGTKRNTFLEIYNKLESVGASLGFRASTHSAGFSGRSLSEDLPLVLSLLGEILQQPLFLDEYVERLRSQLLTGLAIRGQDTAEMASLTFDQILFDGHPYSLPSDGWPETIKMITRDDLVNFHQSVYGPVGMVISIVGAVDQEQAAEQVYDVLGNWQKEGQIQPGELPTLEPLEETIIRHYEIPGKSQSDVVIGTTAPMRKSDDFLPASLGNSILGQFGLMGRIGDVVRERSGLAYYAYSSLSAGIGPGSWEVSAGVNPGNIEKAQNLIVDELKRFVDQGISLEELADSQANFIGRLPLSLETNAGVANALINIERYELGLEYYRQYPGKVLAVTPEDVLITARKYINPDLLAVATAGSSVSI
ncbi:MAG: insulinase family protein [Anaerolineales bacterium]|nr:insulinase family protein [Anaerolineales bacterium]